MREEPTKRARSAFSQWTHPALTSHEVRRVAVHATCDPRVVVRYLNGENQHETVRQRIASALTASGHGALVGTQDERRASTADAIRRAAIPAPSTAARPPFGPLARPQRA